MEPILQDMTSGQSLPVQVIAVRLIAAVVLCALIGLEREWTQHPAGLRTHMLVGLATAMFALLSVSMIADLQGQEGLEFDPLRVLQAVGAAIAFIAAGVVVFSKGELKGLTTSVGIWVASGVGLAAGFGFWMIAGMASALALVINLLLKPIGERIGDD